MYPVKIGYYDQFVMDDSNVFGYRSIIEIVPYSKERQENEASTGLDNFLINLIDRQNPYPLTIIVNPLDESFSRSIERDVKDLGITYQEIVTKGAFIEITVETNTQLKAMLPVTINQGELNQFAGFNLKQASRVKVAEKKDYNQLNIWLELSTFIRVSDEGRGVIVFSDEPEWEIDYIKTRLPHGSEILEVTKWTWEDGMYSGVVVNREKDQ